MFDGVLGWQKTIRAFYDSGGMDSFTLIANGLERAPMYQLDVLSGP